MFSEYMNPSSINMMLFRPRSEHKLSNGYCRNIYFQNTDPLHATTGVEKTKQKKEWRDDRMIKGIEKKRYNNKGRKKILSHSSQ